MSQVWSTNQLCLPPFSLLSALHCLIHQSNEELVHSPFQFLGRNQTSVSTGYLHVLTWDSDPRPMSPNYMNIFQRSPGGFLEALPTGQVLEGSLHTPISQRELGKGVSQQKSHSLQRNLRTNPITESIPLPSDLCAALMRLRPPSLDSWITIVNMYMRDPLIQPIFWYLSD